MALPGLLNLPTEVQSSIFDFIPRSSDLKSLCLVSTQVATLATPQLYRNIDLPYDEKDKQWETLQLLASSRGISAGHVRSIKVGSCNYTDQGFCKAWHSIIQNLPKDTLRRFEYSPLARPEYEDLKFLWRNQRRLTNLSFDFSLKSPSSIDLAFDKGLDLFSLSCISEIDINFGDGPPEESNRTFLRRLRNAFPGLRKFTLKFPPSDSDEPDSATYITEPLLSRILPRTLRYLSLVFTDIKAANELPLDEFPDLKYLELIECGHIARTLENYMSPKLESFVYHHDCLTAGHDQEAAHTIARFLHRTKHLKRLIVDCFECFIEFEAELAAAILQHAASLECLLVNYESDSHAAPDERYILDAARNCKGLKQLSMSINDLGTIAHCVRTINSLPLLSTLNVFNLEEGGEDSPPNLTKIAQQTFNQVDPSSRLRVLAFEKNTHYGDWMEREEDPDASRQQIFGRCKVTDPLYASIEQYAAIYLEFGQVKYIEPNSDILDYKFLPD